MTEKSRGTVTIVVPVFCPGSAAVDNVRRLCDRMDVIVVDDGSGPQFADTLAAFSAQGCQVICLDRNRGIAAALNAGIAAARSRQADYVLTLDQDTNIDRSAIEDLTECFDSLGPEARAAAIGPGRVGGMGAEAGAVTYAGTAGPRPWLLEVVEALQSGLLISMGAVEDVGPFDETLVIDGVDTEFCLRARRRGYHIFVDTRVSMDHSLGIGADARRFRIGPWRPIATEHSARRRYYITRNRARLLCRYASREPRWALLTIRRTLSNTLLAVTVEPDRAAKARAVIAGLRDAILRRDGWQR